MIMRSNNNKWLVTAFTLLAAMLWAPVALAQASIESVRLHRAPDHTRIVFDLP